MSEKTQKRPVGRPPEPNSLRETARREGKTLWRVRKEREAELEKRAAAISCG